MTVILIGRYQENESATQIAYKQYAATDEDQYPTFRICFNGDGLYRYNGSAIYEAYGINPSNYEKMLQGKPAFRYEYDPTRRLFNKTSLPLKQGTDLKFMDLVQNSFDISDIITSARFEAENTYVLNYNKTPSNRMVDNKPPFYISYQIPKKRCLTRKVKKKNGLIRHKDEVYLDLSFLDFNTKIELFVHYPGQLIRALDSPTFESDRDEMRQEAAVYWPPRKRQIKMSQSTVWRKRSVKNKLCLKDVDSYDQYFQQAVSRIVSCVPPFCTSTLNFTTIRDECTSLEKLKKVNNLMANYKKVFDEIQTPCIDMFNSVAWSQQPQKNREHGEIAFIEILYTEKYYEEILQVEDFGVQDFISNLGGFIGIFLGYSMMQVPELLGKPQNVTIDVTN